MHNRWSFERGDKVRILEGAYRGLEGVIDDTTLADRRLSVLVAMAGRHTRIELAYGQVRPL